MASVRMFAAAAVLLAAIVTAQSQDCTTKLAPCLSYLNSTGTPPATCCVPLKDAVANQKACLCQVYNNPELLKTFGVNSTQVVNLAHSCGVDADPTTLCNASAGPSSSPPPPTTAAPPPPAGKGVAVAIGIPSLLLPLVSFMFY